MIHRLIDDQRRCVVVDGADIHLDPGKRYDTEDPEDARVIAAFPGLFVSTVEAATAAPGERRNTRR